MNLREKPSLASRLNAAKYYGFFCGIYMALAFEYLTRHEPRMRLLAWVATPVCVAIAAAKYGSLLLYPSAGCESEE